MVGVARVTKMKLQILAPPMLMLLIGLNSKAIHGFPDATMTVSYEGISGGYNINVNFDSQKFTELYSCLCAGTTSTCNIKYTVADLHVLDISPNTGNFIPGCKLYQCKNYQNITTVICTNQNRQDSDCSGNSKFFFSIKNFPCDAMCVGLMFKLPKEKLTVDNSILVQSCRNNCCSRDTTQLPISTSNPVSISTVSTVWSSSTTVPFNNTYNVSEWRSETEENYLETIILSGIGGGILLVAIIIFIIFLLVKKKPQPPSVRRENNYVPEISSKNIAGASSPDFRKTPNQKNGFFQNMIKNKTKDRTEFVFPNVTSGAIQRRGVGGTQFNDLSSTASSGDNNRSSSNEETEYAVIDENQMQPEDRFNRNNSRISNPFTKDNPDDGYSTLDHLDYYNIQEVSSSPESSNASTDDGSRGQGITNKQEITGISSAQNRPLTSPLNQLSEYSVAKAITEDQSNEDNSQTHQVRPSSTAAVASRADGDTTLPLRDRRVNSHEEHDNGEIKQPAGESKRATYFELEKEEDADA